jgi:hypothetical protein
VALMELYQEDRELVPRPSANWRGYVLSGWWRRVGAAFLDTLVVGLVGLLVGVAIGVDLDRLSSDSPGDEVWLASLGGVLAALAIRVVRSDEPSRGRAQDGHHRDSLGRMAHLAAGRCSRRSRTLSRYVRQVDARRQSSPDCRRGCGSPKTLGRYGHQSLQPRPVNPQKRAAAPFDAAATAPFMLPKLSEPGT